MSGTAVIRYLLANNGPVLAIVPAARIQDNDPALGAVMPFIVVDDIDTVRYKTIKISDGLNLYTERVQVAVLCKGQYGTPQGDGKAGCKALLKLVVAACPSQRATVNGIVVDSISPDTLGPSLHDQVTDLWTKSQDFLVRWVGT